MKISIIHPSRSRPEQAVRTAKKWLSSAKSPNEIEYILSTDDNDDPLPYQQSFDSLVLPIKADYKWWCDDNKSAIDAINNATAKSVGDLIIVISDDFDCPFHWDAALLEALQGKSDYLIKTQDGIQKTLITLPIMDRAYYQRTGYIYNILYQHMYCDQEMTAVGHMLGRVIEFPIKFPHNHYSTGRSTKDAVSEKADSTYVSGLATFNARLLSNFGLAPEQIVKPYRDIVWH